MSLLPELSEVDTIEIRKVISKLSGLEFPIFVGFVFDPESLIQEIVSKIYSRKFSLLSDQKNGRRFD